MRTPSDVAAAAIERVSGNGGSSATHNSAVMIATLATQVSNISSDQEALTSRLEDIAINFQKRLDDFAQSQQRQYDSLNKAIAEGRQTPWGTIWPAFSAMLVFITIIGGIVWYPIRTGLDRVEGDVKLEHAEVEHQFGALVPRTEHERKWAEDARRFNSLESAIDQTNQKLVPRIEYDSRMDDFARRLKDDEVRLDRAELGIGAVLQDSLKSAQNRIRDLEQQLHSR